MVSISVPGHLMLYFTINLSLSTLNKIVLGKFPYPWLLTTCHATFTTIGSFILLKAGYFQLSKISRRDNVALMLFSILFTVNIAISNVSLSMVSLPFHQIMRSICPLITVLIYRVVYNQKYSTEIYLCLFPLICGIGMTTYGDYYFTIPGFLLSALGVILASIKTITTNSLMTGSLKLPALEILLRMCPLAAIQCLVYAGITGEIGKLWGNHTTIESTILPTNTIVALAINGLLAFAQNVSSFTTNKAVGALTITVCANLKQCLTILLGTVMFHLETSLWNGTGTFVTLGGVFWYSWIEVRDRRSSGRIELPK